MISSAGEGYTFHFGSSLAALMYLILSVYLICKFLLMRSYRNLMTLTLATFCVSLTASFTCLSYFDVFSQHPVASILVALIGLFPMFVYVIFSRRLSMLMTTLDSVQRSKFDELKEEFLSVASHELRTPLSVINGFAEILVREKLGPLNDEQKRRIRKILSQGQRLNRIIDELLDLSRIRSGKIECRSDIFDIVPVLKAILDDHQIVCDQQQLTLKDEIPDIIPDVVGDLERVTQVIVNLLNNAIKYTDPGGTVTLTASFDKSSQMVRIDVKDSGIGVEPQDHSRVFKEFYRATQNHQKKYAGSGLGLTIVRQLVEAQGGSVGVESEGVGKGSNFYFTLPVSAKHDVKRDNFISPLKPSGKKAA